MIALRTVRTTFEWRGKAVYQGLELSKMPQFSNFLIAHSFLAQ